MTRSKPSARNKKWVSAVGTLAGVGASTFINFYCQGQTHNLVNEDKLRKKWVCINDVDEPPRQIQAEYPYWGRATFNHSTSTATVSGTTTTL